MDIAADRRTPVALIITFVVIWFQVLFTGFGALLIQTDISSRVDHGQEVSPSETALVLVFGAIAVGLAVVTVFAHLRFHWARITIIVVELVSGGIAVLTFLVMFDPASLSGVILPAVVVSSLVNNRVRDWFS